MVGQQTAIFSHQKSRSKNIQLQVWSTAVHVQLNHAFVIEQRFSQLIYGDQNWFSGSAIQEFDDNMQQTNAGAVVANDGFGELSFRLDAAQPSLRIQQLLAQVGIGAVPLGHLLFQS